MSLQLLVLSIILVAGSAEAQAGPQAAEGNQPATAAPAVQSEARLAAEIADLREMLIQQRALIDAQARQLAEVQKRLDDTRSVTLSTSQQVAMMEKAQAAIPTTVEERLEQIEQSVRRVPEMPSDVVSAGDFPASLRVPGTDAAFRIGGQARITQAHNLGAIGSDDRFITSSIAVEGTPEAGKGSRTTYSARPTRLNFDIRTPVDGLGHLRSFVEADFAGGNDTSGLKGVARLRHAFIQGGKWLVGQTWSTFSDPEAEPIGIDFEGLNAISLLRQSQLRYTWQFKNAWSIAAAVEDPAPSLTDAQGVNQTPDFVVRLKWSPRNLAGIVSKVEHVQAAILTRQLRGEVNNDPSRVVATGGFGVNLSGVLVPRWDQDDRIRFATNNGYGIGRYITDLGSLGGQDAVYDPVRDQLRSLPVSSGYFGYERMWRPGLISTVTYGVVNVSTLDIQPGDALSSTQRATLNLTWSPLSRVDLVAEFLTGSRRNKDGLRGQASQIQLGSTFRF